jgi:beta-catenin-like protein 1
MEEEEDLEFDEDELYIRKLEGGLFALQMVDYILAWVIMEDDGVSFCLFFRFFGLLILSEKVKDHVSMLLKRRGMGFKDIVGVIEGWRDNLGEVEVKEGEMGQKEVLEGLLGYLRELV